ncbi:unnamed protein product [Penicillium olsonii]|uniref:EF-hand domain-containing protein n=1 Tax=Penicillium olsonii TaxID=99116 RepID=A0A9W4N8T4_PENOL|nr:unnamed protein product [Penicillium olsonii]CAG8293763.1 unnamed protein product [Penicillium olsonii]CAG8300022.1 unnamed protein product [Penicillium olsonii]
MAYNKSYNPDALPAHAEPEQVAQMIGSLSVSGQSHSSHPSGHSPSMTQKPLPSRPPTGPGGVPPRVPVSSAPPQNAYVAAPPRLDPQTHHSYSGRSSTKPLPSQSHSHSQSYSQSQSRPHPLHPSPPPQNYGFGPPPAQRPRPAPSSRPPQSPAPPPLTAPSNDPQQLFPLFRAANSSHSGTLTENELGSALVNGDYTSFHPRTVRLMIRMFDRDGSGTINFDEFVSLWRYLAAWRELFDRFDEDRSGRISKPEFENALVAFGYRLSPKFIGVIFGVFEAKGKQMHTSKDPVRNGMSFDLFVQACISLKRMTDVFKRYDEDRDGYITLSFEEALTGELNMRRMRGFWLMRLQKSSCCRSRLSHTFGAVLVLHWSSFCLAYCSYYTPRFFIGSPEMNRHCMFELSGRFLVYYLNLNSMTHFAHLGYPVF